MITSNILVVDDEFGIRFFLEELLTIDGHTVTAVDSGEKALLEIEKTEFDLALLDLQLSGIGGLDVLSILRQRCPDTVVIMLTAHASLETAVEALRQGAHDYLFKPCKTMEIRESIRQGLAKRRDTLQQRLFIEELRQNLDTQTSQTITDTLRNISSANSQANNNKEDDRFLKRHGLVIDFMRHVMILNGELLELSPTEFALVAYLANESPRVVSSQELLREIHGQNNETEEANEIVRYHIYHIRRKIKVLAPDINLIRTVRGVGYTLDSHEEPLSNLP